MEQIIGLTVNYVKQCMGYESTGHDWWHVDRVRKTALHIAAEEEADHLIVELAALLHDLGDWKLNAGTDLGSKPARQWLDQHNVDINAINHVCEIIDNMSFRGGNKPPMNTIEGKIVQDADRLDALGAIGIARAFAFGGKRDREIYNPGSKPETFDSFEAYRDAKSSTINHFYEKLLLLKDKMNTETGKTLAEERHKYMENYLKQFYYEWDGKL
jgi:uncharacterized protein